MIKGDFMGIELFRSEAELWKALKLNPSQVNTKPGTPWLVAIKEATGGFVRPIVRNYIAMSKPHLNVLTTKEDK